MFHTRSLPSKRLANIHGSSGCKHMHFTRSDLDDNTLFTFNRSGCKNKTNMNTAHPVSPVKE